MKYIKKIIYQFTLLVCLVSCANVEEQIFDKIPEDQFPENEAQAALVLIQAYKELLDLVDDNGWWFLAQETSSDELVFPVRLTDWEDGGKWRVLHTHEWDNNTDAVNSMWSHMYEGVVAANRGLDDLAPFAEEDAAKVTIAKLKTLRAFYYYLLIDNYGDVPLVLNFYEAEAQPSKSSKAEIYEQIVNDLKESVGFLPLSALNIAVSKGMAYTLLAKLYLNAEVYTGSANWAMAEAYCDSVINLGIYSLDANVLSPFVTNNDNSSEIIFAIPFDEVDAQGFRLHMRTLHYLSDETFDMVVGPWNGCAATEDHYKLYSEGDERLNYFLVGPQKTSGGQQLFDETAEADLVFTPEIPALVIDASYSLSQIRMSGARIAKYEIASGADENLSNNFPLFRYADVLLMKAEAAIRNGGNGDMEVNMVRERAGVDPLSGVTLDQLLDERGREMFCEGHRRQDLIRFGKFNDAWWEKPASSPDRNTFPIPQWAIDANPNLN